MTRILLALALVASPIVPKESKPIAAQVSEARRPAAATHGKIVYRFIS